MKIMVIGSMKFVHEMQSIKKDLEKLGHKVSVPYGSEPHLKDSNFVESLDANLKYCIKHDVMRGNFRMIAKNDAVLVLNNERNNIDGYIGTSALMEMAIAYYLGKKIFLMKKTPSYKKARWAHEVAIMQPNVINGDLNLI